MTYIEYTLLYDMIANRITIDEVKGENELAFDEEPHMGIRRTPHAPSVAVLAVERPISC